jgi:hypothetical protein
MPIGRVMLARQRALKLRQGCAMPKFEKSRRLSVQGGMTATAFLLSLSLMGTGATAQQQQYE